MHYGMMMIARAAAAVGEITAAIQSDRSPSVNRTVHVLSDEEARGMPSTRVAPRSPPASPAHPASPDVTIRVGNVVHERWMNIRFLCVTGKFWGEPCALQNTP